MRRACILVGLHMQGDGSCLRACTHTCVCVCVCVCGGGGGVLNLLNVVNIEEWREEEKTAFLAHSFTFVR